MGENRFRPTIEGIYRLPQARPPALGPGSLVALPAALFQGFSDAQLAWQAALYQLAWEQAQVQLQPSLPERDLLAVWN
jgi:hypothetical protein